MSQLGGAAIPRDRCASILGHAAPVEQHVGIVVFAPGIAGGGGLICLYPPIAAGIQGPFWFTAKILAILFFYIWMRATLPRFRYDQLMALGWRRFIPLALANIVVTALVVALRS